MKFIGLRNHALHRRGKAGSLAVPKIDSRLWQIKQIPIRNAWKKLFHYANDVDLFSKQVSYTVA